MQNSKTKVMVEGAVMVALATVLSFIKVFNLPQGGSITLLSMLPIVLFSIRRGTAAGVAAAFAFSIIQLFQGVSEGLFTWGLTPALLAGSILLDYLCPFTVLGLAGMFKSQKLGSCLGGIAIAIVLRLVFHYLSGVVIWQSIGEMWGINFVSPWLYSLAYNASYMLPELIFTLIGAFALLKLPRTRSYLLSDHM